MCPWSYFKLDFRLNWRKMENTANYANKIFQLNWWLMMSSVNKFMSKVKTIIAIRFFQECPVAHTWWVQILWLMTVAHTSCVHIPHSTVHSNIWILLFGVTSLSLTLSLCSIYLLFSGYTFTWEWFI